MAEFPHLLFQVGSPKIISHTQRNTYLRKYCVSRLEVHKNTCLFQQDGALPHFHRDVTTFLDATFPGRWVGRGGPTAWPPRSPDLTPLDFFAWDFIKDAAYRRKVWDLADLRQCIIEAVELITPHMLINTWQELEYRLDICRATTGAHTEVYGRA
jgi:hypothetical protein